LLNRREFLEKEKVVHRGFIVSDGYKGEVRVTKDDIRDFIVRPEVFVAIQKKLAAVFGTGAAVIIGVYGEEVGRIIYKFHRARLDASNEVFLEQVMLTLSKLGWWGHLSLTYDFYDRHITIRVWNNPFALAYESGCVFLKAVWKGLFSEFFNNNLTCEEVRCKSKGNEYCEFELYLA
jgi:predicted hydrocarbon binding protein